MLESRSFAIAPCDKGSSNYRVKRYRERAEELRTIAEDVVSDDCHDTLIRLADTYDQMALQAAARLLS
ncbi:MAG TPA: hypothetical protein VLC74_04985 [Rhizomicrobium sp.]|nr:hypothetical protein [Rhizomicrobium sp.]